MEDDFDISKSVFKKWKTGKFQWKRCLTNDGNFHQRVKFCMFEESVKTTMKTLEREVLGCFQRRDKKWVKQLKQKNDLNDL